MNDRYLFKAKTKNVVSPEHNGIEDGKWVFGYILQSDERWFITEIPECDTGKYMNPGYWFGTFYEVDPTTICQCTGLKDKNKNLIWENDIVFVTDDDGNSGQVDTGIGEIEFLEGLWYICGRVQNSLYDIDKCFQIEIIGNIFDNHELLEVE